MIVTTTKPNFWFQHNEGTSTHLMCETSSYSTCVCVFHFTSLCVFLNIVCDDVFDLLAFAVPCTEPLDLVLGCWIPSPVGEGVLEHVVHAPLTNGLEGLPGQAV